MSSSPRFILASASPRRRALLLEAGFTFDVCVSGVDETIEAAWRYPHSVFSPGERIALELAARKARAVAALHSADRILGADTVVVTEDGEPLGIPRDRTEARRMIGLLNGRPHRVHTGVVLINGEAEVRRVATAIVRFRNLTPDEIEAYVETGEGDDKAGAYGYQGIGRQLIASVDGDPETVIGLPIKLVREMLAALENDEGNREGTIPRTLCQLISAAVLLVSLLAGAHAEEWTEYRYVTPLVGAPVILTLEAPADLTGGDTSIVRRFDGRNFEILASDTVSRRLIFHRATEGQIEYIIEPIGATVAASASSSRPASALRNPPPPPAPAVSSAPAGSVMPPPIVSPPAPIVLATPPRLIAATPSLGAPTTTPPDNVLPSPAIITPVPSVAVSSGGPVALERPTPLGRNQAPDTTFDRYGVTKPGEVAHFTLAQELIDRGLYSDAIAQFLDFVSRYPKSSMKEAAMMRVGQAYHLRGEENERESIRQKDLRRSGVSNEAIDAAIADFSSATDAFRVVQATFPASNDAAEIQLAIASALHGQMRTRFLKGGPPEDEPEVVVEYLRVFTGHGDTRPLAAARLGIAQYYRDLGDARMASRTDRALMLEAYNRAMKEYRAIVEMFPKTAAEEESLIDLARLFDRNLEMRRFDEAVRLYDLLASRFPTSRFAEEARARSKWIKENYL